MFSEVPENVLNIFKIRKYVFEWFNPKNNTSNLVLPDNRPVMMFTDVWRVKLVMSMGLQLKTVKLCPSGLEFKQASYVNVGWLTRFM